MLAIGEGGRCLKSVQSRRFRDVRDRSGLLLIAHVPIRASPPIWETAVDVTARPVKASARVVLDPADYLVREGRKQI